MRKQQLRKVKKNSVGSPFAVSITIRSKNSREIFTYENGELSFYEAKQYNGVKVELSKEERKATDVFFGRTSR